jgi:predicted Zn-dependent peptidase
MVWMFFMLSAYAESNDAVPEEPVAPIAAPLVRGMTSTVLENGMKVTVLTDPDHPVVATQIWMDIGSAHETSDEAGFAHLFEHLMFGATTNNNKDAYTLQHYRYGGTSNAYTSFDNTVYISEIPPEGHDGVLALEADRLANLIFSEENLVNEKKIVTEELRMRGENNPVARLLAPGLKAVFGDHPYGHSPAGTKDDIAAATLDLTKKFYSGYYRPQNAHLVVVGPVDAQETIARVEALFGSYAGDAVTPPATPRLLGRDYEARVDLREKIPPVKVSALVYRTPAPDDADYYAFSLLTQMLSGDAVDRFREELVENRGKAMEAMTVPMSLRAGSIWVAASINLPFRWTRTAFKHLHQTIDALDSGDWMTDQNLATARKAMLRSALEGRYFAASEAGAIGEAWSWQRDVSLALDGKVAALNAVTLDDIRTAWKTYVVDATPTEVLIRRGKALAPQEEVLPANQAQAQEGGA